MTIWPSKRLQKARPRPGDGLPDGSLSCTVMHFESPPNALIAVSDGVFVLTPRGKRSEQHLAVNFFMRSVAEERGSKSNRHHSFRHRLRWHSGPEAVMIAVTGDQGKFVPNWAFCNGGRGSAMIPATLTDS